MVCNVKEYSDSIKKNLNLQSKNIKLMASAMKTIRIRILRKTYEALKPYPLFFFNAVEEYDYSTQNTSYYWEPEAIFFDDKMENRFHWDKNDSSTGKTYFCYGYLAGELIPGADYVELNLVEFNPNDKSHVRAVFLLYLNKASNTKDEYSFREFLWMLNRYSINIDIISEVVAEFDVKSIQPFFLQALKEFSICLSVPKQKIIQHFLHSKGVETAIYCPSILVEAISKCFPSINIEKDNISILWLFNLAVVEEKYRKQASPYNCLIDTDITNFLLKLRRWLKDDDYVLDDYSSLIKIIRLLSPQAQVRVIQRYFYAISKGQIEFNAEVLSKFKINRFEKWGRYFHCSFEPANPIRLAVPLLCDNILTFLNSSQQTLQTINGTLDLAYDRCDSNSPDVDFGLSHIVPVCKGGVVPDKYRFKGFICYQDVICLNDPNIKSEVILSTAKTLLNQLESQQKNPACHSDKTSLQTCNDRLTNVDACKKCDMEGVEWLDKWVIKILKKQEDRAEVLKIFINKEFPVGQSIEVSLCEVISNPNTFRRRLNNWLNKTFSPVPSITSTNDDGNTIRLEAGWVSKEKLEYYADHVVKVFLKHSWFKVEPRKDAYIGCGVLFPILGISETDYDSYHDPYDKEYVKIQENSYVVEKVKKALIERIGVKPHADGAFYVPYNQKLLRELKSEFYTHPQESDSSEFAKYYVPFLRTVTSRYDRYCAPKYKNGEDFVTGLSFFWCRGKECFKNSLANQTLASVKSWQEYTILHMLEILGYPQITRTPAGNETSELIRGFIGIVNKAESLFRRIRCRECNHLLFPIGSSQFNRYNKFACRVPHCSQHGVRVYLSHCHHCKSGLIDSRDSARCPNGWHICPKCLSCCDDAIYEHMASKYIVAGIPVPRHISDKLGHGHNDKDLYFCPKCGGEVKTVVDEHTYREAKVCQNCRSVYKDNPESF